MKLPGPPLSTYVIAHLPGWMAVALIAWVAVAWFDVPRSTGVLVVAVVLLKDALSYRTMRRYYTPEPAERRLVSHSGVAVTPLSPRGWVRVRGELWQARVTTAQPVPPGTAIRVCDIEGLILIVEARSAGG